jgi:Xaa-Pro aminopeptidase
VTGAGSGTLRRRHAAVRQALRDRGFRALVVTHLPNVRYLTNHAGSAGLVVVESDRLHLVVDGRYAEAVRRLQDSSAACPGATVHVLEGSASYDETLVELLAGSEGAVGVEAAHLTIGRHATWRQGLERQGTPVTLAPVDGVIERQRMVKDAEEIAALRTAAARLTPVVAAAHAAARPGVTERRVAAAIDAALGEAGFERPAFETIVATGPNSALPHHRPGERPLADGDLVVLDFGGVLGGYCSDLTRTVGIGTLDPARRAMYEAVREAQAAAVAAIRPGADGATVDAAAREVLAGHGLGEAFSHGTGHGLGLEVHEDPRVGRAREGVVATRLEPGMVFTVEPGAYVPGVGGVRIEDDVLVTPTGCEILTDVPRELLTLA